MKYKVIAFADHEIGYRLLQKIINNYQDKFELLAVITSIENKDSWWPDIEPLCKTHDIPLYRYSEPLTSLSNYSNIDWFFLLSWKFVLPPSLLYRPKSGVINLHYSVLPKNKGVYPVNRAIIDGNKKTGVTYHIADEKIDHGKIICQDEIAIELSDTARTLQLRLDDLAFNLFDRMLEIAIFKTSDWPDFLSTDSSYQTRADFISSYEIDLNENYKAINLINFLRGHSFRPDTQNIYMKDPETGKKIYINISLTPEK